MPVKDTRLIEANVNPRTGLATDYLNHFNEAIMLLELCAEMPECRNDFFAWHPKKYSEHFAASKSKHRNVTIAAYNEAEPALREQLDRLATIMNEILTATREVMRQDHLSDRAAMAVANVAVRWIKPLIARAGAVINGTATAQGESGYDTAPQMAVDALMAR